MDFGNIGNGLGIDWNPLHGSAFTGAGTPWGPTQTGLPEAPQYNIDPSKFKGYDSSGLRQALERRIAQGGQQQRAQNLAGMSKAGVHGADAARGMADIAGQQNLNTGQMNAGLDQYDYQTRVANMAIANQALRDKYLQDYDQYNQEQQGRAGFGKALTKGLATGAGYMIGGPVGAYIGSQAV